MRLAHSAVINYTVIMSCTAKPAYIRERGGASHASVNIHTTSSMCKLRLNGDAHYPLTTSFAAFFLKDILWVPPSSKLNVYRLIVWWLICMPGLRDYYAFVSDSSVARIGPTCWIMLASCILELLLVLKWGYYHHYAGVSPPPVVVYVWLFALTTGGIAIAWWFGYELPKRKAADSSSGGGSSKRK